MKRTIVLSFLLLMLSITALCGCSNSTPSDSSNPAGLPDPVTGTYRGKTITMGYAFVPEMNWDLLDWQKAPDNFKFINGFVRVALLSKGPPWPQLYTYMDKTGKLIDDEGWIRCMPFSSGGSPSLARVQLWDSTWIHIDTNGRAFMSGSETNNKDLRPTKDSVSANEEMYSYKGDALPNGSQLWGLMNQKGNRLTEPIYANVDLFVDGLCPVVLAEGKHKNVLIDKTGAVKAIMPDDCSVRADGLVTICQFGEPGASYQQLYDTAGKLLNETKFDSIGEFYRGLALIIKDKKVGLIDHEGNVVILPTFAYDTIVVESDNRPFVPYHMSEDLIVIPIDGKVAMLQITRTALSDEPYSEPEGELPVYVPGSIKLLGEVGVQEERPLDFTPRPFRAIYYHLPPVFYNYISSHNDYNSWCRQIDAQWKSEPVDFKEMVLVSAVKHFNIPKSVFVELANQQREDALSQGLDIENEFNEIPNADIIYTFDDEIINHYYRRS